jgi:GTPase-activating protein SST2
MLLSLPFSDEAAANLASLKFSQSNRGPDPKEPSRVVTTTTTTTFSMTRDMAKAMCQHFMDARLIENAADPNSNLFKDRGVYILTPKGLHVLERFISKNGINSDHLQAVFATQPICIKLLHLERRTADDEIIVTQSVITALFRRFVGRQPNYQAHPTAPQDPFERYNERAKGVSLMDTTEKGQPLLGRAPQTHKNCFAAVTALEWLCDFTSVVGREEAAEMAAQFVRFGLITLVSDKRKSNDSAIIFTVRGSAPGGNSPVSVSTHH